MRCITLTLHNYCQYNHREFNIGSGLVGVFGANGSGKSNFLNAIRFALTGAKPGQGNKIENVRYGTPDTEDSYVSLLFEHGATQVTVTRYLQSVTESTKLEDGQDIIYGDKKVTAKINEILGLNADILNDIVIVAQTDIYGFLDKAPQKRAELFQRLFNLGKASKIYAALTKYISQLQTNIKTSVITVQELDQKITHHEVSIDEITQILNSHKSVEELETQQRDLIALNFGIGEYKKLQQSITTLEKEHERLLAEQAEVEDKLKKEADTFQTIDAVIADEKQNMLDASAILKNIEQNKKSREYRDNLQADLDDIEQKLASLTKPTFFPASEGYIPSEQYRNKIQFLTVKLHDCNTFINSIQIEDGKCPTCGSNLAGMQHQLQEQQQLQRKYAADLTQHRELQKRSQQYEKELLLYNTDISTLQAKKANTQSQLEKLAFIGEDAHPDIEYLQGVVEQYNVLEAGFNSTSARISELEQNNTRIKANLTSTRTQIDNIKQSEYFSDVYASESDVAQEIEDVVDELSFIRGKDREKAVYVNSLEQYKKQREQLLDLEKSNAAYDTVISFVKKLQALFHKDGAPRFVMQQNLSQLQHYMNDILEIFQTDYRVTADSGVGFVVKFFNGTEQPQYRLSGGQRVVLALAFRLALILMLNENVGAIYLDEPTAYLDSHHINQLHYVFDKLKEYSVSRGLQCLIITHEQGLTHLFDSTIQI